MKLYLKNQTGQVVYSLLLHNQNLEIQIRQIGRQTDRPIYRQVNRLTDKPKREKQVDCHP